MSHIPLLRALLLMKAREVEQKEAQDQDGELEVQEQEQEEEENEENVLVAGNGGCQQDADDSEEQGDPNAALHAIIGYTPSRSVERELTFAAQNRTPTPSSSSSSDDDDSVMSDRENRSASPADEETQPVQEDQSIRGSSPEVDNDGDSAMSDDGGDLASEAASSDHCSDVLGDVVLDGQAEAVDDEEPREDTMRDLISESEF